MLKSDSQPQDSTARPLCVDLDGTILRTDTLPETVCLLLKQRPLDVLRIPLWLLQGKAVLKRRLAERASLDPEFLPYHAALLEHLREERARGRRVVMVTASDELCARRIADHLGLFDGVIASDGSRNVRGEAKRTVLEQEFGHRGFDYVGNDHTDLPAWRSAEQALVVGGKRLRARAAQAGRLGAVFEGPPPPLAALPRMLRMHQWVKNLLIFVPLIMAHRAFDPQMLLPTLWAFVVFCICASGVYVLNDLLDLEVDRRHPTKRHRPLAAGAAPLALGLAAAPLLFLLAAVLAVQLPLSFVFTLVLYIATTMAYSLRLKQIELVDIFVLAALYTLRIFAGACAAGIPVSPWLLAFSMFMFLSLACIKRFSELYRVRLSNGTRAAGRGYTAEDLDAVAQFGSASGFISVLVLALYINGSEVAQLYHHPTRLWLLCPLLLYWVARVWLLAHRGELHEDPIVFAIEDKVSYLVGALSAVILAAAKGF